MAKDKKERAVTQRDREHARLKAKFDNLHKKAPHIKRVLRGRGIDLPFYDYYDSYYEEFQQVAAQAEREFPSLLGICEVEDGEYYGTNRSRLAPGMQQIFWRTQAEQNGYGAPDDKSNINGYANAFRTADGRVKTLVVIRKSIPKSKPHREFKYVLKLIALLHELGHVHDMERQINFDQAAETFDVVEAEVFAHLYSIRRMVERNYFQCYTMLVEALKKSTTAENYLRDVARLTLERMPDRKPVDVNAVSLGPLTAADAKALGAEGLRAFGSPP